MYCNGCGCAGAKANGAAAKEQPAAEAKDTAAPTPAAKEVEPPAETAQPPAASRADYDPADFTEAEIASGAFALAFVGSKRASPVRWDT